MLVDEILADTKMPVMYPGFDMIQDILRRASKYGKRDDELFNIETGGLIDEEISDLDDTADDDGRRSASKTSPPLSPRDK